MFVEFSLALYMVPIAVTICFGLAFSTFLVLLVVPALLQLIEDWRSYLHQRRSIGFGRIDFGPDNGVKDV